MQEMKFKCKECKIASKECPIFWLFHNHYYPDGIPSKEIQWILEDFIEDNQCKMYKLIRTQNENI